MALQCSIVTVGDLMVTDARFCRPDSNLAEVAAIMWNAGCGALPVLNELGRVTGMITDRDISIALGTRNFRASEVLVREVSPPRYFACASGDDIHAALKTMATQAVRRLPVVDHAGNLAGVLSIDDIILRANAGAGIDTAEVMATLKAICANRFAEHGALAARA